MLQRIRRIDGSIVLILLLLMCVSIFSIYSVTHGRDGLDGTHIRMVKYYVLGFAAFILLALFDYRLLVRYGLYIYTLGMGILLLVSFIEQTLGRDHFIRRFDPWLVPERASSDASYQTRNAKTAIASGGLSGEGYLQGGTVQSDRVPYLYSVSDSGEYRGHDRSHAVDGDYSSVYQLRGNLDSD
jgi:cell division protein FtsW (lipid II flippase)